MLNLTFYLFIESLQRLEFERGIFEGKVKRLMQSDIVSLTNTVLMQVLKD